MDTITETITEKITEQIVIPEELKNLTEAPNSQEPRKRGRPRRQLVEELPDLLETGEGVEGLPDLLARKEIDKARSFSAPFTLNSGNLLTLEQMDKPPGSKIRNTAGSALLLIKTDGSVLWGRKRHEKDLLVEEFLKGVLDNRSLLIWIHMGVSHVNCIKLSLQNLQDHYK